jgi:hypothetical protein
MVFWATSALKIELTYSSKMLVAIYQTTQYDILEECNLNTIVKNLHVS